MNAKCYHTIANLTPLAAILGALSAFAAQDVREEFHQNYPLNKAGKIFLENVNGNVHVVTWDRDEVKLDAVKHAKKQELLDEVKIEVDAKADSIRIKTKYPDSRKSRNNSTGVDYTLTVPKQSNLAKVSTVNGPVTATGLANEANLSSVNGSVRASFFEVKKDASLKSVNGSVTVAFPKETDADLSGSTLNGGISSDFGLNVKSHFPVGKNLDTRLGKGGPVIKMSSVNGGIHIDRSGTTGPKER